MTIPGQAGHCSEDDISYWNLYPVEVPLVNQGKGQHFERVVQFADAIKAKQQAAELVLSTEHPLNGVEALFKDLKFEKRLVASFWLAACWT